MYISRLLYGEPDHRSMTIRNYVVEINEIRQLNE
jgi:hypothetical protein